jgi:hypothetical protein
LLISARALVKLVNVAPFKNTVIALALLAGMVAAGVMVWRARRESQRLEDEVRRVRRQVDEQRRELEVEQKRAEWKERKWRKFGGEWEFEHG